MPTHHVWQYWYKSHLTTTFFLLKDEYDWGLGLLGETISRGPVTGSGLKNGGKASTMWDEMYGNAKKYDNPLIETEIMRKNINLKL